MAISEKRYVAEFLDREGNAFKFDDIWCMLRYLEGQASRDKVQAYFVMDYNGQGWLEGVHAFYVKSPAFHSPMGSGLIALRDRAQAEDYSRKFKGQILTFDVLGRP